MSPVNDVAGVLERAWHKISTPDRWIQGADRDHRIRPNGRRYYRHCSIGAIHAVRSDPALKGKAIRTLAKAIHNDGDAIRTIIRFNDCETATHDNIREAFEAAIAMAKAKESEPLAMDIKEIPDVETEHFPLVSPVPDKEVISPAIPAVPALPSLPAEPEKVPA